MRVKQKVIDITLNADSKFYDFDLLGACVLSGVIELRELVIKMPIGAGIKHIRLRANGREFLSSSVVHLHDLAKYHAIYRRGYINVLMGGIDSKVVVSGRLAGVGWGALDLRMFIDFEHKKNRKVSIILIGDGH